MGGRNRVSQGTGPAMPAHGDENPLVDVLCNVLAHNSLVFKIEGRKGLGKNSDAASTDVAMFMNDAVTALSQIVDIMVADKEGERVLFTFFESLYVSYGRRVYGQGAHGDTLKKAFPDAAPLPRAKSSTQRAQEVVARLAEVAIEWTTVLYEYIGFLFHLPIVSDGVDKLALGHLVYLGSALLTVLSSVDIDKCRVVPRGYPDIFEMDDLFYNKLITAPIPFDDWTFGNVVEAYQSMDARVLVTEWSDDVDVYLSVLQRLAAYFVCTQGPKEEYETGLVLGNIVLFEGSSIADDGSPLFAVSQDGLAWLATEMTTHYFRAAAMHAFTPHSPISMMQWLVDNRDAFAASSPLAPITSFAPTSKPATWIVRVPVLSPHDFSVKVGLTLAPMLDEIEDNHVFTAVPLRPHELEMEHSDIPLYRDLASREDAAERTTEYCTADLEDDESDPRVARRLDRIDETLGEMFADNEDVFEGAWSFSVSYTKFLRTYLYAVCGMGSTTFDMVLRTFRESLGQILMSPPTAKQWLMRMRSTQPSWRQVLGFAQSTSAVQATQEKYIGPHFQRIVLGHEVDDRRGVFADGKIGEALQLFMFGMMLQSEAAVAGGGGEETFSFLDYVVLDNELHERLYEDIIKPVPTIPVIVQMWGGWHVVFAGQRVPFAHAKHAVFFWCFIVWLCTDKIICGKFSLVRLLDSIFEPEHEEEEDEVVSNDQLARMLLNEYLGRA